MDTANNLIPWLELTERPAFCVKNDVIVAVNTVAARHMLQTGTNIYDIVAEHLKEYKSFTDGCLYLPITIADQSYNCNVTRTKEYDIFLIDHTEENERLQTLALAAQHLLIPLSNIMTVTDRLLSSLNKEDPAIQKNAEQISRNLFQLLRIVGNMSDTSGYQRQSLSGMQTADLPAIIREVLQKTQAIAESAGLNLQFTDQSSPVFGLADSEKLERAIYNLLSNAFKFSKPGSCVEVKLTNTEKQLSFSICNTSLENTDFFPVWHRYQRKPAIEDSRYGLGLGMTLISSVAIAHGGTVLIDHPAPNQTRITMSIAVIDSDTTLCHSPIFRMSDYAGGRDKSLLELSEILSADFYKNSI